MYAHTQSRQPFSQTHSHHKYKIYSVWSTFVRAAHRGCLRAKRSRARVHRLPVLVRSAIGESGGYRGREFTGDRWKCLQGFEHWLAKRLPGYAHTYSMQGLRIRSRAKAVSVIAEKRDHRFVLSCKSMTVCGSGSTYNRNRLYGSSKWSEHLPFEVSG